MSANEHVAIVRRGYEAFNKADMATMTALFHESASWQTPGRSPRAGDRKGRDAVFAHFGALGGETGGTFKATLLRVYEGEDGRVIGVHRNTGERNGKRLDVICCLEFDFNGDKIGAGREYFDNLYAWDDFWS
jgi:uncharacterized protein